MNAGNGNAQNMLSFDEMCSGSDDSNANSTKKLNDSTLPSIDSLQPLSIQLEQSTTPSTSGNSNGSGSEVVDDIDKILKAIKNEFKGPDTAINDGDNADCIINVYDSSEEDGKYMKFINVTLIYNTIY